MESLFDLQTFPLLSSGSSSLLTQRESGECVMAVVYRSMVNER